jgi:DNA-binding transcriptional regulator YiaG
MARVVSAQPKSIRDFEMRDRSGSKRTEPMDAHIGQQLRIARLNAGLTQTALGKRLGVTFQQVQKYEKGANRVSGARLGPVGQTAARVGRSGRQHRE